MRHSLIQCHAHHRQRHVAAEYCQSYRENNSDEFSTRQRNVCRRNVERSRFQNKYEYLGETLSHDIPPSSNGILSEE